jgi:hypothetical protein
MSQPDADIPVPSRPPATGAAARARKAAVLRDAYGRSPRKAGMDVFVFIGHLLTGGRSRRPQERVGAGYDLGEAAATELPRDPGTVATGWRRDADNERRTARTASPT